MSSYEIIEGEELMPVRVPGTLGMVVGHTGEHVYLESDGERWNRLTADEYRVAMETKLDLTGLMKW
jgi:hypothetical protein